MRRIGGAKKAWENGRILQRGEKTSENGSKYTVRVPPDCSCSCNSEEGESEPPLRRFGFGELIDQIGLVPNELPAALCARPVTD